ncbi:MAG: Hsp20/alpha crystallin family protein [Peptococcaceae bacterium]|nr:Hsp20/alpha crystallin family protein [Peptococcaceae bacterium]
MALRRWDPFNEMNAIRDQLNRMWDVIRPAWRENNTPRVDMHETENEIVAVAELPGVQSKDEIEVNVSKEALSIKGEIKRSYEANEDNFLHSERFYGTFSRTLPLPVDVKPEEAKAEYKDGLLTIRIPKSEQARQKHSYRVPIQ